MFEYVIKNQKFSDWKSHIYIYNFQWKLLHNSTRLLVCFLTVLRYKWLGMVVLGRQSQRISEFQSIKDLRMRPTTENKFKKITWSQSCIVHSRLFHCTLTPTPTFGFELRSSQRQIYNQLSISMCSIHTSSPDWGSNFFFYY